MALSATIFFSGFQLDNTCCRCIEGFENLHPLNLLGNVSGNMKNSQKNCDLLSLLNLVYVIKDIMSINSLLNLVYLIEGIMIQSKVPCMFSLYNKGCLRHIKSPQPRHIYIWLAKQGLNQTFVLEREVEMR